MGRTQLHVHPIGLPAEVDDVAPPSQVSGLPANLSTHCVRAAGPVRGPAFWRHHGIQEGVDSVNPTVDVQDGESLDGRGSCGEQGEDLDLRGSEFHECICVAGTWHPWSYESPGDPINFGSLRLKETMRSVERS